MTFSDVDQDLLQQIKSIMHTNVSKKRLTAYTQDAKLVWTGKHYLLVKTGPWEGHREAELWSREYLLLKAGNPTKNTMMEIALATIPLFHKKWHDNYRRVIWRSGSYNAQSPKFADRRWSKSLVKDLIEFCEERDATFEVRAEEEERRQNGGHSFSQKMCDLFLSAGIKLEGTIKEDDVDYPANKDYHVRLPGDSWRKAHTFFCPKTTGEVRFGMKPQEFSPEEFEILADALISIYKRRKEA